MMRTLLLATAALLSLGVAGVTSMSERRDPAHWREEVEQALLPLASLRADLVIREPGDPAPEIRARLHRALGPSGIRSVVAVEGPTAERRVLRITSTPGGGVERVLYAGEGDPVTLDRARHEAFLLTAFTYEDLGFVDLRHLDDAELEFEDLEEDRVVRLTTGPHGPYSKVVMRVDPETALPRSVQYFDPDARLERTVSYGDVEMEGRHHFPLRIEAVERRSGRRSVLRFRDVELGPDIRDYEFGDRHLRSLLRELLARSPA